jgi:hypothetical protein
LISRYLRLFSFMLIPITALFAWMFFKKQKFNVLEHSILIFYVWGHLLWLSIINLFLFKLFAWNLNIFQILLQAVFYAFGCITLYTYQSNVKVFFKGLTVCLLAFTIYTIFISILGFSYLMTNPEMMELLKNK